MVTAEPFKLHIGDKELRKDLEQAIIRQIVEAVDNASERNDQLQQFDDMLNGYLASTANVPWRGACELDDPLTRDNFLTCKSMMIQALSRDPKVMVEAIDPEDEKKAQAQEPYLTAKFKEAGADEALAAMIFNVLRWPYAVVACEYDERYRPAFQVGYKEPDSERVISEEEKQEGVEYEEVPQLVPESLEYRGLKVRTVASPDFYLYPSVAKSIETAKGCGERMYMTDLQLIDGIDDLGLDEEEVYKLLNMGPTHYVESDSFAEQKDEREGIASGENGTEQAGYYEVFVWYTRMPLLWTQDRQLRTPRHLLRHDFLCITCPYHKVMLRMDFNPFQQMRPYTKFCMIEEPDRFQGWCIPTLLDALQAEANAAIRHTIDSMNIGMNPCFKVKEGLMRRYENFRFGAGKYLPVHDMDDVQALEVPQYGVEGWKIIEELRQSAERLCVVGGFGQMTGKVYRNQQIQALNQAAFTKFDLYLFYIRLGLEKLWRLGAAMLALHMPDDGEDFLDEHDGRHHITPESLRGRYIYRPTANSQTANPESREQIAAAKTKISDEYGAMEGQGLPPQLLKRAWNARYQQLIDLGEHNPEDYIGKEPQVPEGGQQPGMPPPQAGQFGTGQPMQRPPMMIGAGNGNGQSGESLVGVGG